MRELLRYSLTDVVWPKRKLFAWDNFSPRFVVNTPTRDPTQVLQKETRQIRKFNVIFSKKSTRKRANGDFLKNASPWKKPSRGFNLSWILVFLPGILTKPTGCDTFMDHFLDWNGHWKSSLLTALLDDINVICQINQMYRPNLLILFQVGMALLLILTMTTLNSAAQENLPKVSYIKSIDIWFQGFLHFLCIFLLIFSVKNKKQKLSFAGPNKIL